MARSIAKTIEPDEWIPRIDAAQRAGVHRNTIIEWERRRLLRVKRGPGPTGEQVLVSARDLGKIADKRPPRSSDRVTRLEAETDFFASASRRSRPIAIACFTNSWTSPGGMRGTDLLG
jgi:hypothetical protein